MKENKNKKNIYIIIDLKYFSNQKRNLTHSYKKKSSAMFVNSRFDGMKRGTFGKMVNELIKTCV